MDTVTFAAAILAARWSWTASGLDADLRALGLECTGPADDHLHYRHPTGFTISVRCDAAGEPECAFWVLRQSRLPDDCDEADWDDENETFDRAFLEQAHALAAHLGNPSFFGRAPRGRTWDGWADRIALWPQPAPATAWLQLQLRQDDTDVPIEIDLVWTPRGRLAVALQAAPLPPITKAPAEPEREHSSEAWLRAEAARAVELGKQGQLDEAIEILSQVTRAAPFWGLAWNDLGMALSLAGECDEAVACFDRAIEEDPTFLGLSTRNRVETMIRAGTMAGRYQQLTTAANAGQATAPMLFELALVLERQRQPKLLRHVARLFLARAGEEDFGGVVMKIRAWLADQPSP